MRNIRQNSGDNPSRTTGSIGCPAHGKHGINRDAGKHLVLISPGESAVTVFTTESKEQLQQTFAGYPLVDISEGVNNGYFIKFGPMDDTEFRSLSALIYQKFPDAKVDQIGETFGKTLQSQAVLALIFSFIGMAIVIFVSFRTFVPAVAVVLSAFADMVMTAATMNIIGIPLSLGTLAALLMLIGYSVDSDILLTNRVLKRQGKLTTSSTEHSEPVSS